MSKFSDTLEAFRKKSGYSKKDLANLAGIAESYVSHLTLGSRENPSPETIAKLATALKLNDEEKKFLFEAAELPYPLPSMPSVPQTAFLSISHDKPEEKTIKEDDWDDVPNLQAFFGREEELKGLKHWILEDHCQLLAVSGSGGIGKTMLTIKLARGIDKEFAHVFWRSLKDAPSLEHLLEDCLSLLSHHKPLDPDWSVEERIRQLVYYMKECRCLLILDNMEAILQEKEHVGEYLVGYEAYGNLLDEIGRVSHQSCLIITTREIPEEIALRQGRSAAVRLYPLEGLKPEDGLRILEDKALAWLTQPEDAKALIDLYSGNPLALELAAVFIRDALAGDISTFLASNATSNATIFESIQEMLQQQFERLSALEQQIMYWLAIEREAVTPTALQQDFTSPPDLLKLGTALQSLRRRSLIEIREQEKAYSLQAMIQAYVTRRLIDQVVDELKSATFKLMESHILLKAHTRDYLREAQRRQILAPIAQVLLDTYDREECEAHLHKLLLQLHSTSTYKHYAAVNLLHLFLHLGFDLSGSDFSHLYIRQAYLQGISLPSINFSHAQFIDPIFTDAFGSIFSVAWDANNKIIAAGTANNEVRLWRASDGKLLHLCQGHTDYIRSIAFSPDGTTLVSGSNDQSIRIWDVQMGRYVRELNGHTGRVYAVAFSPDGQTIASGSEDDTIRIWDVQTGHYLRLLEGHNNRVWSVAFSPDGKTIASGSEDNTIRIWDVQTSRCLRILDEHGGWIYAVAFSPDGQTIASGSEDDTIRIWDVQTGRCMQILSSHTGRVYAVAFSPDGQTIASGSEDDTIRVWDVQTGRCLRILYGHQNWVWSVAFSPDGKTIVSGSHDQSIRIWDVQAGQCLQTLKGYNDLVYSVAFSPDGKTLISGNYDQSIRIWDVQTGQCQELHGHKNRVWPINFSPDGKTIVSGSHDQSIRIWDVQTGQCIKDLLGHNGWIYAVAFSPDGKVIASGSHDKTIKLWNVQTGQCLQTLDSHRNRVWSVAFSPDGQTIVSGSDDKTLRLWDVQAGKCLQTLQYNDRIYSVAFSPDGQTLASGSHDQSIQIWDVQSGQCLRTLHGHRNRVWSVAFSPDGKTIVSGSHDQSIRIWDVQAGQCIKELHDHTGVVYAVAFSPDGQTIASGSEDNTIRIWDVQTGRCLKILKSDKPYENMNITEVKGLSVAQKAVLKALGAIEN